MHVRERGRGEVFRYLILLDDDLSLPPSLVGHKGSPGKRKERVEERLELVDREDRKDERHFTSTQFGRGFDPVDRHL